MSITLEQVEKIREKAGISYGEAKSALERNNGDLLDALIDLERQGKSDTAQKGGFYTTKAAPQAPEPTVAMTTTFHKGKAGGSKGRERFGEMWRAFLDLLNRTLTNQMEIWKGDRLLTSVPVLILVLLAVFFFWITFPLLIAGFFYGVRYHFTGPDLGRESINKVMESLSSTVDDMKENVKRECGKRHHK